MARSHRIALISALIIVGVQQAAEAQSSLTRRALALFKNKQYADAAKLLEQDVEGKPETKTSTQDLLLGECYYVLKQFGDARPHYVRAVRNLPSGKNKVIAEQRLVKVLYLLKDFDGALERIESFIDRHGKHKAVGNMLVYRMTILSMAENPDTAEIERFHKQIQDAAATYGGQATREADRVLSSHYQKLGQAEKAREIYKRIVYTYRDTISKAQQAKKPVPAGMMETHDNAALQMGMIEMTAKRPAEAIKWFENVRYDPALVQKAKLLLAKLHYDRRDFDRAIASLTAKGFVENVSDPILKSDMYLVIGLAEASKPESDFTRVEHALTRVSNESKNYYLAQRSLGDARRDRGLYTTALESYVAMLRSPEHEPYALLAIGRLHMDKAKEMEPGEQQRELFAKASTKFDRLFTNYPLAPEVKEARQLVDFLKGKGVNVAYALTGDEKLNLWKKIAQEKPGTVEAAQALMSLIREYAKTITDEKSGKIVQAPNFIACAQNCKRLLDESVYKGADFAEQDWKDIRAEASYQRAASELASLEGSVVPGAKLPDASVVTAINYFRQAQSLTDPKHLALVKQIRLGLVEALFKSGTDENVKEAEAAFVKLEADYGNDARFQKLALDLAEWYKQRGDFVRAAQHYAGVADRAQDFAEEQRLQLLFAAGTLYGQAARQSLKDPNNTTLAIHIRPKQVIDLGNRLLSTWHPFRRTVELKFPNSGKQVRAYDALVAVSKASGIPFIWIRDNHRNGIAQHLNRRVNVPNGTYSVKDALEKIIDVKKIRVEFDIGITGGQPTIPLAKPGEEKPGAATVDRVVELYSLDQASDRLFKFAPLNRNFGAYERVFGKNFTATAYRILKRIEEVSETRILWADGIDREDRLAQSFTSFPGINTRQDRRTAEVLEAVLKTVGLEYTIIQRPLAADHFEAALSQYNKIRQINPRSDYSERSLFRLALDFYSQKDYGKMKIVLREYLKMFDGPEYPNYRNACFWVGWAFENDHNYRDAVQYYQRAAEERLVIYVGRTSKSVPSAATNAPNTADGPGAASYVLPPKDELLQQLSHELQFALIPPVSGEFKDTTLRQFVDFLKFNTHIEISLDGSAQSLDVKVDDGKINAPAIDLLHAVLKKSNLHIRVENVEPDISEKAYYRLGTSFQKDDLMQQALESCDRLLTRYPNTKRRTDAYRLMVGIYKGLKDYGKALQMLEQYRAAAGDTVESFRLDAEIAGLYFDMANYEKATRLYLDALKAAQNPSDRLVIREGYARSLYRQELLPQALAQYEILAREQVEPIREFVSQQMVFLIKCQDGKAKEIEYPNSHLQFIKQYENLSDEERGRLSAEQYAKATWIYYVLANMDIQKGRKSVAKIKLDAVINSPDESLSGQAAYQLGLLHMQDREYDKARAIFEHLLFSNPSSESVVRGTYALGRCWMELKKPKLAGRRFAQLARRYPQSPQAKKVRNDSRLAILMNEAIAESENIQAESGR